MENLFCDVCNIEINIAKKLNPQVLAFVGDGVYTLFIRTKLSLNGNLKGDEMHKKTTSFVKASGQSDVMEILLPMLSQQEVDVFKRARNYRTPSVAKHANIIDYKRATGFEALVGFLYLTGQIKRLNEILSVCYKEEV